MFYVKIMSLTLNEAPQKFKEFYGRNVEQMPLLIAEGRTPLSVAGLMQRRLETRTASAEVKSSWMDNYFDTGDAVVYHPNGNVKIVLDSQTLREMNSQSKRNGGALVLGEDVYNALQGEEFNREQLGILETSLSTRGVKFHPVWRALARDEKLLNDYTDLVFAEAKQKFKYDTNMGVYLGTAQGKTPEMRAVYVLGLESRSVVDGRYYLGSLDGRLVGVAPEAQSAKI